ncbi:MAG: hypothetical protein ABSB50_03505 [Terracidiphilus sp.]
MPTMMAVTAIATLIPQLIAKASGRASGSGNNPKVACPGEYVVGISKNLVAAPATTEACFLKV